MATRLEELDESDFYVWTQRQAEALRRLAETPPEPRPRLPAPDRGGDGLGASQRDAVCSQLRRHHRALPQARALARRAPARRLARIYHRCSRRDLGDKLSPSLRRDLDQQLPRLRAQARSKTQQTRCAATANWTPPACCRRTAPTRPRRPADRRLVPAQPPRPARRSAEPRPPTGAHAAQRRPGRGVQRGAFPVPPRQRPHAGHALAGRRHHLAARPAQGRADWSEHHRQLGLHLRPPHADFSIRAAVASADGPDWSRADAGDRGALPNQELGYPATLCAYRRPLHDRLLPPGRAERH